LQGALNPLEKQHIRTMGDDKIFKMLHTPENLERVLKLADELQHQS